MKIKYYYVVIIVLFFISPHKSNAQIPNSDLEYWTHFGSPMGQNEFDNPDYWNTSNSMGPISSSVGKDSINVFSGNYAAKLITMGSSAYINTGFFTTTRPFAFNAYVKCTISDSDTVSIKILLLNNDKVVDSGYWHGYSDIDVFTQIWIPITQNASLIDSIFIEFRSGDNIGTTFTVDYLSLNNSANIEDYNNIRSIGNIKVYPNPADYYINCELDLKYNSEVKIIVYDNMGKIVSIFYDGMLKKGLHHFNMDVSEKSEGLYYIKIIANDEVEFTRVFLAQSGHTK
jgi:hypothetical protein